MDPGARAEVGTVGSGTKECIPPVYECKGGVPGGGGSVTGLPRLGVTGPRTGELLPTACPEPHTYQDPLEERILLGREAHGRHRSGSSRCSRHRPARSVCLSDDRRRRRRRRRSLVASALIAPIHHRQQASGVTASPNPANTFPSLSFFFSHLTLRRLPPPRISVGSSRGN